jgi:Acyltransferase family
MMALLFLVAGLLSPPSLERKGPGAYVRGRLLRLGVPFVVYVLIVQPAVMYGLEHPLGAASRSYWYEFLGAERQLDTGPLWFVGVLLIFSLIYAGWVGLSRRRPDRRTPRPVTARRLLGVAAVVAPASFLIRLMYPYGGDSGFADLNFWEWPACVAIFAVGIVASAQGWLAAVPDRLSRHSRGITGVAVAAMAALHSWSASST